MTLKEIYHFFVQEGMKEDLRTPKQINQNLLDKKHVLKQQSRKLKKFFDKEDFSNPYADTRILYGDPHAVVRRILVGIDMEVGELLLADRLSREGKEIDLVLAHHPEGHALAGLHEVMDLQADILVNLGVEKQVAKDLMEKRVEEVTRGLHSINHMRSLDAARLLNIPFLCCHTPSDNHVAHYLQRLFDRRKPKTLGHVIDLLLQEPEYQTAVKDKAGPKILIGDAKDPAGKIFVDMTGGTEGSKEIFARLSQLGIRTVVGMHFSEAHFTKMKTEYIHVINAGHIASDNLGMNLLLDKLQRKTEVEIIECSGFRRIKR